MQLPLKEPTLNSLRKSEKTLELPQSNRCSASSRTKDEKEVVYQNLNKLSDGKTARMRKLVEQLSNPIFGGTWLSESFHNPPKIQNHPEQPEDQLKQ